MDSKQLEIDSLVNQIWEDEFIINLAIQCGELLEEDNKFKEYRKLYAQLFALLMIKQTCAIQVLVGFLLHKTEQKLIEPVLTVLAASDLVQYKELTFTCLVPYKSSARYILPSSTRPKKVINNQEIGYENYKTPLILGSFPHDYPVNYDYINLTNSVQYTLEHREIKPVFNSTPKIKKDGTSENQQDILKRYESFEHVIKGYQELNLQLDKFFYCHCYDSRGRVYPKAYEFNYQGIKFIKSVVKLAKKEVINHDF